MSIWDIIASLMEPGRWYWDRDKKEFVVIAE